MKIASASGACWRKSSRWSVYAETDLLLAGDPPRSEARSASAPSRLQVGIGAADDLDILEREQAIQVDAGGQAAPGDPDPNNRRTHGARTRLATAAWTALGSNALRCIRDLRRAVENAALSQQHNRCSSRVYPTMSRAL